jgi:hypothetical protein
MRALLVQPFGANDYLNTTCRIISDPTIVRIFSRSTRRSVALLLRSDDLLLDAVHAVAEAVKRRHVLVRDDQVHVRVVRPAR